MGYTYNGPSSIYTLTWNEALRALDGSKIMAEDRENSNINDRDLDTWADFNEELEER